MTEVIVVAHPVVVEHAPVIVPHVPVIVTTHSQASTVTVVNQPHDSSLAWLLVPLCLVIAIWYLRKR